jgi:hypothetical protein
MNEFVLLFDLVSAAGIVAVAYLLYKKFFRADPAKEVQRETAYEEGFSDAVKYFGLKQLYQEDPILRRRMESVFGEAGISHRIAALLEQSDEHARGGAKERSKQSASKAT